MQHSNVRSVGAVRQVTPTRSPRNIKLSECFDSQIAPLWSEPFAKLVLPRLDVSERASILELGCATGSLTEQLLARSHPQTRIIAIDSVSTLVERCRTRISDVTGGSRVFLRSERISSSLAFADHVFDKVLYVGPLDPPKDLTRLLAELVRVAKPGAQVAVGLPMLGSYEPFVTAYSRVLDNCGFLSAKEKLNQYEQARPQQESLCGLFENHGCNVLFDQVEVGVEHESIRDFLFSPLVRYGPLSSWKHALDNDGELLQQVLLHVKDDLEGQRAIRFSLKLGVWICTTPE